MLFKIDIPLLVVLLGIPLPSSSIALALAIIALFLRSSCSSYSSSSWHESSLIITMPRGAKGGSLFVRRPRGSKSPLNVLASLSLVSLTLAGIAFIAIPRFNTAVYFLLANKFPCWTDDPTPSFSKGIFKCRHEEKQEIQGGQRLNHTIKSRKELMFTGPWTDTSKGKPDYNSPWFYAPSKLSLCWIPKVGCTKSKLAYAHLTGVLKEPHIHAHSPPSLELDKYTVDDLNHIFSADDWLNIVVVRDPLERFISGYLDKVWNEGWFNPGRTTVAAKRNYNLTAHSVLKFLGNDHAMSSDHFAPQSAFCGLRSMVRG